jgi:hypothetical protein
MIWSRPCVACDFAGDEMLTLIALSCDLVNDGISSVMNREALDGGKFGGLVDAFVSRESIGVLMWVAIQ